MAAKASTQAGQSGEPKEGQGLCPAPHQRALPATGVGPYIMLRAFLIILAAGLIALAAGFAYLGEFPPSPHVQTVVKVLPNDRFQSH